MIKSFWNRFQTTFLFLLLITSGMIVLSLILYPLWLLAQEDKAAFHGCLLALVAGSILVGLWLLKSGRKGT